MYHMKNIVSFNENIELPKCMYRLKNPIEVNEKDEAEINIQEQVTKFLKKMSDNGLIELENRQEKLLSKLDVLYDRIKSISTLCKLNQQEVKLAAGHNNDYMTTNGLHGDRCVPIPKNTNVSALCRKNMIRLIEVKPNEVVMFLNPDKLPWFLNLFLKKIKDLNVSWHIHSSVPSIKVAKINAYFKKFQSLYNLQSNGQVNFRLIFKCESATPELKISSLSGPILGSVNILRYLCLIFPNVVNYDYDNCQIDALLDNCHLLEIESVKNKEVIITEMFTNTKNFVHKNAFSVVDVALFNVIKQLQTGIKLVPKIWYNDCEKIIV